MNKFKKTLFLLIFAVLFSSCSFYENRISEPVYEGWKISMTDNKDYAKASYYDGSWKEVDVSKLIKLEKNQHYLWLRKNVKIPSSLRGQEICIGFQRTNVAVEVFVNGVYIGSRGSFPPNTNIRIEENRDVLIPSNLITGDSIEIALRLYSPGSVVKDLDVSLDNEEQGFFANKIKNVFNQRIFLCIGVLCCFILFYALLQFLMDTKNTTFLYFVWCLFFIILYFYDLGSENSVINFNIQRSFTRACLPISMLFLFLFLHKFYNRKKFKLAFTGSAVVMVVFLAAFLIFTGNDIVVDNLFLFSMAPTLFTIVYGFIVTIQGVKSKLYDSIPVLIGFITGSCCALHDIICQIAGVVPFMWTQGFAFFLVDLSVFITLAIRESNIKKEVVHLAEETKAQKDKLFTVIEKAKSMAEDSNEVAEKLNQSVDSMINSSKETKDKVVEINKAIAEQTRIREETAKAVDNLTDFLKNMTVEFENETAMIQNTANGTQDVINGISTVGEGISTAAEFTSSLSKLTQEGSEDMKKLMTVMESIQASSKEILGVVTTLDDFAQQTDLLSMNASIEAAHSGEAGKGFAVIAHEIKKLASQTSQWSKKIADIILNVIKSIEYSASLTSKVNKTLSQIETDSVMSAERVNAAWEGMKIQQTAGNEIAKESSSLADSAAHMKSEIENQNVFASSVMNNMQDLMIASNAVNDASNEISSFTEELSNDAHNLATLAETTAMAARELMLIMKI